jgi:hypothetical protein
VVRGRQAKVSELASHTLVRDEDVLRLQVPVVDSNGMAVLHGIQNLEESILGQDIVSGKLASFCDVGKQVAFRAVLDDYVSAIM